MNILILLDHYLPGFKAGGPIKAINNLVKGLAANYNFEIINFDRDKGDQDPYHNIRTNEWNELAEQKIFYLKLPGVKKYLVLYKELRKKPQTILYLNSFFSPVFSIFPLCLIRLRLLKFEKIILAPRGELCAGALKIKKNKKFFFIFNAKLFKLYESIIWQATNELEKEDILKFFPKAIIKVVSDLPDSNESFDIGFSQKEIGKLKLIFLSRINQKKNLLDALKILKYLTNDVEFAIYGPIEDKIYWRECQKIISLLPKNIKVRYCGIVEPKDILNVFKKFDLFLFPTFSENYGYVIIESLAAGCPVAISDTTPWQDLEKHGAGFVFPLNDINSFVTLLNNWTELNAEEHQLHRINAFNYALKKQLENSSQLQRYQQLFAAGKLK